MKFAFANPYKNTRKNDSSSSATKSSMSSSMSSSAPSWSLRLITLLLWMAVALCAAYWAFKFVTTKPVAAAPVAVPAVVVDSKAVAKLLGASDIVAVKPVSAPVSTTKYLLFGIASTLRGAGVALIGIDDKPARPYRVGSKVADDLVLKSLTKTKVVLAASSSAPDGITLELPVRKPATLVASSNRAAPPAANPVNAAAFVPPPALIPPAMPAGMPPSIPPGVPPGAVQPGMAVNSNGSPQNPQNQPIPGMVPPGQPPVSRFAPRAMKDGEANTPTATSSTVFER
jgi:general secretion pathway protein C